MSVIKWYKRDPNAALSGMMVLTLEERGAYNTVLDLIYSHDNNLIDDDRFISGWLRCDLRVWKRIKARLIELGKIEVRGGLVTNFRATSEVDEALSTIASVSELNRIKGIKSGIARRKNKELPEPRVEPNANTPTPTTRIPHTIGHWDIIEKELREAAGWQSAINPNLAVVGPIVALIGAGCDWELDVIPTVKALAHKCRGVKTWKYFINAIQQARDDRLGAMTAPNPTLNTGNGHARKTPERNTIAGSFAVVDAAIDAERRRIEALERELGQAGEGKSAGEQGVKLLS